MVLQDLLFSEQGGQSHYLLPSLAWLAIARCLLLFLMFIYNNSLLCVHVASGRLSFSSFSVGPYGPDTLIYTFLPQYNELCFIIMFLTRRDQGLGWCSDYAPSEASKIAKNLFIPAAALKCTAAIHPAIVIYNDRSGR